MASSSLHGSDKPPSMNVEAILQMKAGLGDDSYAKNSVIQKESMDTVRSLVIDSATQLYQSLRPEMFTVADLGCSSGTNALGMVEDIITSIGKLCSSNGSPTPEFSVLLNDLPANDFNTVFSHLPEFTAKLKQAAGDQLPMVFMSGVPGSFYGRLFPKRSLHFVCSFASLHWLSQVPPLYDDETNTPINKGKMFISSTSPPAVASAYLRQFQRDFSLFLRSRAAEVVSGGRVVITMLGRRTEGYADVETTLLWDLLSESLAALVSQGLTEQEKVDAYDVPFYAPSVREVQQEVTTEGSFSLDVVRMYEATHGGGDSKSYGRMIAMTARAVHESMVSHHFGPAIVDPLFHMYSELVTQSMEKGEVNKSVQIGMVLTRL
ncbi:unnamed protein product [Miscanthus lutarioriparius]|uniref:Uncharacterized protein n=1 Tax=Miscanthus lutarioriparius TaxID=422564 RepID=A0A811SGD4_9POAL|nr:unnamed protein product [Miscanthus lutarioriparius]